MPDTNNAHLANLEPTDYTFFVQGVYEELKRHKLIGEFEQLCGGGEIEFHQLMVEYVQAAAEAITPLCEEFVVYPTGCFSYDYWEIMGTRVLYANGKLMNPDEWKENALEFFKAVVELEKKEPSKT